MVWFPHRTKGEKWYFWLSLASTLSILSNRNLLLNPLLLPKKMLRGFVVNFFLNRIGTHEQNLFLP
jgi:hypothetical protein